MRLRNHGLLGRCLVLAGIAFGAVLTPHRAAHARTEPIEAQAEGKTARAALLAAREAALEQALAQLPVAADPELVKSVMARAEAWTSAYRILEQERDGSTVSLRVEVEIDTKRLAKRVATRVEGSAAGFRLGSLDVSSGTCATEYERDLTDELEAFGIVEDKGLHAIDVELACRDLGVVSWTQTRAARVELVARGPGGELARASVTAFGESMDSARAAALERASLDLSQGLLDEVRGGVMLWVANPTPASRVRQLVQGMRRSVMGVEAAEVAAIGADGAVGIRVTGSLGSGGLKTALAELALPGFALTGYRTNGERELHVTME